MLSFSKLCFYKVQLSRPTKQPFFRNSDQLGVIWKVFLCRSSMWMWSSLHTYKVKPFLKDIHKWKIRRRLKLTEGKWVEEKWRHWSSESKGQFNNAFDTFQLESIGLTPFSVMPILFASLSSVLFPVFPLCFFISC